MHWRAVPIWLHPTTTSQGRSAIDGSHLSVARSDRAVIQNSAGNPDSGSFQFDPDFPTADDRFLSLRPISRAEAYRCDITYGTNNEYGFDYLRDNMASELPRCVQRELHYAIVDEVDNILIDEARTPLIISGEARESANYYQIFAGLVKSLQADVHYVLNERIALPH